MKKLNTGDPMTQQTRALIRWAGSKKKLIPVIKRNSPKSFNKYIEPFCGSISLFLEISTKKAALSDINSELVNFYNVVKTDPGFIADGMQELESAKEVYYRIRSLDISLLDEKERAVNFFYLNRHCFNGVYRTNQKGQFNVPYGSKLTSIPSRSEIFEFSKKVRNVTFSACDFESAVKRAKRDDFIYLDPPYAGRDVKDRGEYGPNKFRESDLERLEQSLTKATNKGVKILLSYADIPQIRELFSDWEIETVSVGRSVSGFAKGRMAVNEVLLKNFKNEQ